MVWAAGWAGVHICVYMYMSVFFLEKHFRGNKPIFREIEGGVGYSLKNGLKLRGARQFSGGMKCPPPLKPPEKNQHVFVCAWVPYIYLIA